MRLVNLTLLLLVLCMSFMGLAQTNIPQPSWLKTSITADFVYEQGLNEKSKASDTFRLREAEAFFYAAIDPKFNGVLSFNAHNDSDEEESFVEIHEGYFESSFLIPGWNIKAGQFFLDLGRLNRIHRHDWDQTFAPLAYQQFFNREGLLDSGVELSHSFGNKISQQITFGVVTGAVDDHGHGEEHHEEGEDDDHDDEEEVETRSPSAYLKWSFFKAKGAGGDQLSIIGYAGNNSELGNYQLAGINYVRKRRHGARLVHLLEFEAWARFSENNQEFLEFETDTQLGGYLNYHYGINQSWKIGARADYFQAEHLVESMSASTYLTWNHSEFFRTRLALSAHRQFAQGESLGEDYRGSLQFVFFLGNHPTHDF